MSVIEDLRGIEERVASRLRELAPLVAEFDELRAVAERLGIEVPTDTPSPAAKPATDATPRTRAAGRRAGAARRATPKQRTSTKQTSKGRDTKAVGAQRRDDVVRSVTERPGITVSELGQALSVDRTALYRVVRRLQTDGKITKQGTKLHPINSR
jgi:hypothetical protein